MNDLIDFFKILSDETRLRIIILLAQEKLCVCEMCGILNLSQPKVSKHLAKLRDKGFVIDERKEQFIFYSLKIEDKQLTNFISNIIENIENYPQLNIDSKRLLNKDIYISRCNKIKLKQEL